MTVYDGGGAIVASLGLEGQAPRHEGHGNSHVFKLQATMLADDLAAGLLTAEEYGELCAENAREYAGWWER